MCRSSGDNVSIDDSIYGVWSRMSRSAAILTTIGSLSKSTFLNKDFRLVKAAANGCPTLNAFV